MISKSDEISSGGAFWRVNFSFHHLLSRGAQQRGLTHLQKITFVGEGSGLGRAGAGEC